MKFYDLFCGIGGFRLGLQRAGHQCVGSCEIDKYAREIYKKNFGKYPTETDAIDIIPERLPDFEILCAGFPCQAFSLAGRRLGFEDTRGTLFYEIARIARQKRPGIIFLENVKGLLYHDEGRTLTTIIKTFYELGYDIEWQIINGKYFLPQNRERIFIIGHLRGKTRKSVFPIGEISQFNDKPQQKAQTKGQRFRGSYTRTIDANYAKGGGSRTMIAVPVLCVNRENRRQNGRRFKTNGEATFTLTTQDRHGIYDGKNIRSLTPLECERLQGFPDNWTKGIAETQRYKCLGNAVMVPVIEYIAKHLNSVRSG